MSSFFLSVIYKAVKQSLHFDPNTSDFLYFAITV